MPFGKMSFAVSDELLATFAPIVLYWVFSGIYALLGSSENHRLHSKFDEDEKNLVSKRAVVKVVLLIQTIEAFISIILYTPLSLSCGFLLIGNYFFIFSFVTAFTGSLTPDIIGKDNKDVAGPKPSLMVLARQFVISMLVWDTWHYFFHRTLHVNKFLYKHIHSQHHRLVVPYAFGALYGHPLEILLFQVIGGLLGVLVSGMSPRASIFFFSFATIKDLDDHCGLWLPRWNPFHIFFRNNSAYHDVHHQLYGSKYNFSQTFFVHWDKILGTYMPYTLDKKAGGFKARTLEDYKDN